MDERYQRNLDWLISARKTLRRFAGRYNIRVTLRGLLIFLGAIVLVTALAVLNDAWSRYPEITQRTSEYFPNRPEWAQLVSEQVTRWRSAALLWKGVSYLLPAMIAAVPFVIVSLVRDDLAYWLYGRILHMPRHLAVGFVLESVSFRFRMAESRRFAVLLFASIGAFTAFLALFTLDRRLGGSWISWFWFLPLVLVVPVTMLLQRFASVWQRVLARMKLTQPDVERFGLVRLVDAAIPLLTFAFVLGVLLLTVPHLLSMANERELEAQQVARGALDEYVLTEIRPAQERQVQTFLSDHSWGHRAGGASTRWAQVIGPTAWRFYAGALMAMVGSFVILLFCRTAPVADGREGTPAPLVWGVGFAAAAAISVYWAIGHDLSSLMVGAYLAGFVLVFSAVAAWKTRVSLTRAKEICPSCDRSFVVLGKTCPVCGVQVDIARRVGPEEFVVGHGLTTVHHRDCRVVKGSRSRSWSRYLTFRQALADIEGEGLEVARPCKICLGSESVWPGDPVWRSARRWASWVRRTLKTRKAPAKPAGPAL